MERRYSSAFTAWHVDGSLVVCDRGDLWLRIPCPEDDRPRWSFFGPVEEVQPGQLSPKFRDALERCKATARDRRGELAIDSTELNRSQPNSHKDSTRWPS